MQILLIIGCIGDRDIFFDGLLRGSISWIYMMIICIHDVDILSVEVIPFMAVSLMSI